MAGRATPPARAASLEQLLVESGTGDTTAFAELFDRLAPRVFGSVTCLVRDPGAAERISCDAFLEVWRRAATYDPATSGAVAWVLGVVRRVAVPASRRTLRRGDPSSTSPFLLAAGLTREQAGAVHLAWYDGLDHAGIEAALRPAEPATALITGGLRVLAAVGPR